MSIESQIRKQVAVKLRRAAQTVIPHIEKQLRASYQNRDFVNSIRSGILKADFGLTTTRANRTTDELINVIADQTSARFVPGHGNIAGILEVEFRTGVPTSVLDAAAYKSNGIDIPWLSWLVREGSRVVVAEHKVEYGNQPRSRSGMGLMVKDKDEVFRVDPSFAGSESDNIITRFLISEAQNVGTLMINEIRKQF